jgi:hypothetical protein
MLDDTQTAAQALVAAYCGWHIAPSKAETITLDGPGSATLLLPTLYVTQLTSVTSDGITVDPEDYDWSEAGIVELRCGVFSSRFRGVTVGLTHGYANMPADVLAVIAQLDAGGFGPQVAQVGQVRVQTAAGMVAADAILDRYRLPPRP